ncbi:type II secretion system secretin GspD [Hirschia baltica]|uniref:General secretion pathway protein D n=1 Tax=Hirschia baltica (strain ATCC 49814 / DSM 5838 / IFAM 1418) TaxID=582402 RepID=C6XJ47_HIRBI|nr:type II secretion system secretin GspD [Hirschia baltica]ACT59142.1 general secretion pathway protein D [Hirschia baltica ATCC 49814]
MVSKRNKVLHGAALAMLGGFIAPMGQQAIADELGETSVRADGTSVHVMNLKDVDISVLIDDVSAITGHTFVVHPSVRGRVSVSSQTPLTNREVFQVFLSTLRVHGFTAIPSRGGVYKIVPEQSASAEAGLARPSVGGDQFETAVIRLRNFDATEAAKMIKPITNPQGQLTASGESNTLIVVDYAANISRVRKVVAQIDEDQSETLTIALTNMSATEMANTVNSMKSTGRGSAGFKVTATAVESNNSLIVKGDIKDVAEVHEIVRNLDVANREDDASLKVLSLKHSEAKDIAPILEMMGQRLAEQARPGANASSVPKIAIYEPTNSLVVSASPMVLRQLERVVEELDQRRSQVLVEAIIVELSDNAARELGLEFVLSGSGSSATPFAATNFTRSTTNVLSLAGALALDSDTVGEETVSSLRSAAISSLLGSAGGLLGIGGQSSDGTIFGAIINAVDSDITSNVLSTPHLLTMDNEKASITVGQEVPITTGEALGTNNSNPFRTVERKPLGVTLEVEPQIGEGDSIKLNLRQEVSSIFDSIDGTDFITNNREINTTILADDGEIVVLGGLIQEEETLNISKVPLLGDIPGVGRLFSSEGTTKKRTNLMVFLKPTIVRDAETMQRATDQKYRYIRQEQMSASRSERAGLDVFMKEVLGVDTEE